MAEEPMTLCERLRNPMWTDAVPHTGPILNAAHTRRDMDEAAKRIEVLEKAPALRNQEVVLSLKWLGRPAPAPQEVEAKLPCDVLVAPVTIFRKGVPISTVLGAIERRRGRDDVQSLEECGWSRAALPEQGRGGTE